MKPKYNFKSLVIYKNIVWSISTVWTEPLPFKYTLERLCPVGERIEKVEESLLKAWDGKVDSHAYNGCGFAMAALRISKLQILKKYE